MRAVVVDTNVIVSAFLSPTSNPAQVLTAWEHDAFAFVVSELLLAEYQRVLAYDRVATRHGLRIEEISEIVGGFRRHATEVELADVPRVILEDPADDVVLATAVAGSASYLISGDARLMRLGEYQGIPILTPAMFLALLAMETD